MFCKISGAVLHNDMLGMPDVPANVPSDELPSAPADVLFDEPHNELPGAPADVLFDVCSIKHFPVMTIEQQADFIYRHRTTNEYLRSIHNIPFSQVPEWLNTQLQNPTLEDIAYICREHPYRAEKICRKILSRMIITHAMRSGEVPHVITNYLAKHKEILNGQTCGEITEELINLNRYVFEGVIVYILLQGHPATRANQPGGQPDSRDQLGAMSDEEWQFISAQYKGDKPDSSDILSARYFLKFIKKYPERVPHELLTRWLDYAAWANLSVIKRYLTDEYPDELFYYIDNSIIMDEIIEHIKAA